MNYGELKQAIVDWSHRTDLEPDLATFINLAGQRIGRRFGVMPAPLNADTDTNSVLTTHSQLYLYGALREVGAFTHDVEQVQAYDQLFKMECAEMNINYQDSDWAACDSPVMCPVDDNPCCETEEENDE